MRLAELYKKEIANKLKEEFGYTNVLAVPRLEKITVNVGVGRSSKDKQFIATVFEDVRSITGQNPIKVLARKSVSAFKVRQGDIVGITTTLRGQRMYDFMEKLVDVTLPRVRDFRGISTAKVDRSGNLSIGFKEHSPFPEIRDEKIDKTYGLEINLTTTAKTKKEGLALLKLLGVPFSKK